MSGVDIIIIQIAAIPINAHLPLMVARLIIPTLSYVENRKCSITSTAKNS
jgi:hypothetical protein